MEGGKEKIEENEHFRWAGHSWEIEYALGNLSTNKTYKWMPDDYKVSALMMAYFENFIKTGNPNGQGLPNWKANSVRDKVKVLYIDVETKLQNEDNRKQFKTLETFYSKQKNEQ